MRRSIAFIIGSLLVLSACGRAARPQEVVIGQETYDVIMPVGKDIIHPVHGKEVWFGVGPMKGHGETKANGVVQSHVFADGESNVTVNLNIFAPPKGYHFVAWVTKSGSAERVRIDQMQNPMKDVRHVATADIQKDLRAYLDVIVTQEKDSGATENDPIVATGTIVERER